MNNALKTQSVEDQGQDKASKKQGGTEVIDGNCAFTAFNAGALEFFESQFRDETGLTTLTSRGFARSDLAFKTQIQAFYVGAVHASRVIPTGGGCRPSMDYFATDVNVHGVSGFDGFHSVPANGNALQGIGDADSLIEDFNLRMNEEQITGSQNKSSPSYGDEIRFNSTGRNCLDNQREHNEYSDTHGEPDRACAVEENIIHSTIFSQQPGLEGSRA